MNVFYRYLLPERHKSSKQKTSVIKKDCSPVWNHTFIFEDVTMMELRERCLELTIWDYEKLASNDFLGGVRLNLGTGNLFFYFSEGGHIHIVIALSLCLSVYMSVSPVCLQSDCLSFHQKLCLCFISKKHLMDLIETF